MAVETEFKTFLCPTSTGNQTHTFISITTRPVAVLVFAANTVAANLDTNEANLDYTVGIGTKNSSGSGGSEKQYAIGQFSEDNVGTSICVNRHTDEEIFTLVDNAGAVIAEGHLVSTAAGSGAGKSSIVINWTTAPGTAIQFHVWAIAGADMVDAVVGSFDADTATGNRDITNIGLSDGGAPDCVIFLTSQSGSSDNDPPNTNADSNTGITIGVMLDNNGAASFSRASEDNVGTSNTLSAAVGAFSVMSIKSGTPALTYSHDYVAMLPDGFRINTVDEAAVAFRIFYLAIRGGKWNRTAAVAPTSTGTQDHDNDDDFTPRGYLALAENSAGTRTCIGIGASSNNSGIVEGAISFADADNQATTNNAHRMTIDSVALVLNGAGALHWEANTSTYNTSGSPGGITLDFTTVQGSGGDAVNLIQVGDGVGAPPTGRRRQNIAVF